VIVLAVVPVAIGLLTGLLSGRVGRMLPPRLAVPLLTGLALTVALCTGIALSAWAILVFAQLGPLPHIGHWSASVLRARAGVPIGLGVLAFVVVVVLLGAAIVRAARSIRTLVQATRASRAMTPVDGNLVVIDDDALTAYAVGGWRGRIVVSRSMLAALSPDERRVVLAHEDAHLRHRHHLYLHLAALAAAANPLVRPTRAAIALGVERWADEDAATEMHDREATARGLASAALALAQHRRGLGALAAADSAVAHRVRALLAPAPAPRRFAVTVIVALGVACWLATAVATWRVNELIQIAEAAVLRR
jgi:beta-lactamase regulating signal transducer with metallopeptidase domain